MFLRRFSFLGDGNTIPATVFVGGWISVAICIKLYFGCEWLVATILSIVIFPMVNFAVFGIGGWLLEYWDSCDPKVIAINRLNEAKLKFKVATAAREVIVRASAATTLHQSTGPEFEDRTARVFRKWGYHVSQMGGANDGGGDLIVRERRGTRPRSVQGIRQGHWPRDCPRAIWRPYA
jgi:hypothetical protein